MTDMHTPYREEIAESLARGRLLIIIAQCRISYEGRIASRLDSGERIILIKQDKSVNIIQPQGVMPVNYMKEGSHIHVQEEDGEIVLLITHARLHETMRIILTRILDVQSYTLHDSEKIRLIGTEKDMHEYIYENPHLISPDFKPLSREEQTKYGYIDLLGHDGQGNLIVVECKRAPADYTAVVQLERYVERVSRERGMPRERIRGVLAAPGMSPEAQAYLQEKGFIFRRIQPPRREVKDANQQGLTSWMRKKDAQD